MSASIDASIERPPTIAISPIETTTHISTSVNASVELPPQPATPTIATTIRQLKGPPITCSQALNTDNNFIIEAQYVPATEAFYKELWANRDTISAIIKHHLGLSDHVTCTVADKRQWIRGSFNVCVPVQVQSPDSVQELILRCAMPHKLAEAHNPGSVDEKLGCEVGAYTWVQERCPEIRIPHLYGFGFLDQRHFTHEALRSPYIRVVHYLRRLVHTLLRRPNLLSRYTNNPASHRLPAAYMLLENVRSENSQMLSNSWEKHRRDPAHRHTLFQGMARIMLSLARIPQQKIGSFQFCNDGTVTLTNRPLVCTTMILENEGTPMAMQRETTYTSTEPFVADMFNFHDKRFSSHPNVIYDDGDCREEMAGRLLSRMVAHHYIRQDQRNGPFFLQLNDFHASNIFVDTEWNITSLIDLEWVCALPVEILDVPYWLTGCDIGEEQKERWDEFNKVREEFMDILEAEACNVRAEHDIPIAQIMRETWESGGVWFWHGITSNNAMSLLFRRHISPRFFKVVQRKVEEYQNYEAEVKNLFRTRQK
ncbi:hypothetical protein DL95DRAFT_437273 [Leptodontidium sp. 2 PMI_412]|nr:hypothetical protein DL95DRAFT_437273 [Leptodontidium sp. 2 PMI_412]